MFKLKVAEYLNHELMFEVDLDYNFWFFIKDTKGDVVGSAAIFPIYDENLILKQWGSLDGFIDNKVIPDCNKALEDTFGKVDTPDAGASFEERLKAALANSLLFDSSEVLIKRK
jgi:hypothetical protein